MLTHILKWGWSRNRQQPPTRNQTGYWGGRCQKWQSLGLLRDFPCRTEADISEGNSGTRLSASSMSAQLAHCILERKRAYTSPYKPTSLLLSTHGKLLETEHPYFFALIKLFLLSQSYCQLLSSMKKKKKFWFFFFFFFHNQKILSLVSFHRSKNKTKEKNTMQWMSQHFDAWVTCTGNILVMNHTISSMGAFPWGEGGRAIVSQCWKGVQHKTTPMAASLIAHRTSDTEKNNNFKNCRKC